MSPGAHEETERRLRAELDRAETEFQNAQPLDQGEARRRYEQALDKFTLFILEGKLPEGPAIEG